MNLSRPLLVLLIAALMLLGGCQQQQPPGTLRLTMLDVGQGECLLVQTNQTKCLIDAGGAVRQRQTLLALRRLGVRQLDLLVLTHPHEDHIGGAAYIARRLKPKIVMDAGLLTSSSAQKELYRWIKQEKVLYKRASAGQVVQLDDEVQAQVLWPPRRLLRGTESDENNNSVVLRVKHGKVYLLMTGDLQAEAEARLLSSGVDVRAHVLKVGHQGSRDSTSQEFLRTVQPAYALISAGNDNAYGHPAKEVLSRLRQTGATVFRTDRHGAITLESDGERVTEIAPN